MKKYFYIIHCILFSIIVFSCDKTDIGVGQADEFIKYYGGNLNDFGSEVIQLPDGGYVVAGTVSTPDKEVDICLIFTNKFGNSVKPLKTIGGNFNEQVSKIILLPDGGVALTGSTVKTRLGDKDIYVVRTDSNGDTLWTKSFGENYEDEGINIIFDQDEHLIITGYMQNVFIDDELKSVITKDSWINGLDLDGESIWGSERVRARKDDDIAVDIVSTSNNYVVMKSSIITGANHIIIEEFDKSVTFPTRIISIGGEEDYFGSMLKQLPDGNFIVLGTTNNSSGESDILLVKFSPDFVIEDGWPKFLSLDGISTGNYLKVSDNQLHIMGTRVNSISSPGTVFLAVTDLEVNNLSFTNFNLIEQTEGKEFAYIFNRSFGFDITSDGGYVLTGTSAKSSFHTNEIVLVKVKPRE